MHDVTIIGGGAAGMTAAIYASRRVLDLVLIGPDVGGQAAWASEVDNYPGFRLITGFDLVMKFEDHVRDFGISRVDDRVTSLEKIGNTFLTRTEGGREFESRAVIVASGRSSRNLGVPGEEDFKGRGISYCATCDAPLYPDENVAVVGGGNAGLDAAVQLSKIASSVSVIEEGPQLTGDAVLQDRISAAGNVTVLTGNEVVRIDGNTMVEGISVRECQTGRTVDIPVAGIFVEIGSLPNVDFLPKDVVVDERSEIKVDCWNRTSVPGIFAAGDATTVPGKQIIIAAGEGAKALLAAHDYIIYNFPDGG